MYIRVNRSVEEGANNRTSLKAVASTGIADVPTTAVKYCSNSVIYSVCELVNRNHSPKPKYPSRLNMYKVISVFENKGLINDVLVYRPIALQSDMSPKLENCLLKMNLTF